MWNNPPEYDSRGRGFRYGDIAGAARARAVFFNRLGEIPDRSFEQQRYCTSGLNLLNAAIVLRNTVYLDRAVATLISNSGDIDPDLLRFLSPLGWEHMNFRRLHLARHQAHQTRQIGLRSSRNNF